MSQFKEIGETPSESFLKLFWRFLKFGLVAWGGPVAQIAMIQRELVVEEKRITPERFNRVLAVYQVLPGPEAHELCVYFGMQSRGRFGALLAGLGFMLPGFLMMFGLSWFYVRYGINSAIFHAVFLGMQPAVAAQIVRAVHRISGHALQRNVWLWGIAAISGMAHWLEINFFLILLFGGIGFALIKRGLIRIALFVSVCFAGWLYIVHTGFIPLGKISTATNGSGPSGGEPSALRLLVTGLRSGLLTFGGAYTAIPFMQHDAVTTGGWMTNAQFLDGLALSGLLPAPLIIFSTFVGYLGGGALGAFLVTFGVFAPAFTFTMVGHEYLERLVNNQSIHSFLDGATASVAGLITATAIGFLSEALNGITAWLIFALALISLYQFKTKWAVAAIILGAGAMGLAIHGI